MPVFIAPRWRIRVKNCFLYHFHQANTLYRWRNFQMVYSVLLSFLVIEIFEVSLKQLKFPDHLFYQCSLKVFSILQLVSGVIRNYYNRAVRECEIQKCKSKAKFQCFGIR